jgi:hypothetical protein
MALHVRFFGVEEGVAYHGYVADGYLASESKETVEVLGHQDSGSRTAELVAVCRDVDGDTHIFSNDERDLRLSDRKAKRVGENLENYFRLMYPDVEITARRMGALGAIADDTSAQTSVLEDGRRHRTFGVAYIVAALCAGVGLVIADQLVRRARR